MLEEAPPPVAQDTTKRSSLGVLPAWTLLAVACCGLVAAAAASPLGPPHPAMLPGKTLARRRRRRTNGLATCCVPLFLMAGAINLMTPLPENRIMQRPSSGEERSI